MPLQDYNLPKQKSSHLQWRIQDLREGGAEVCARKARAQNLGHAHQFTRKFEVRRS